MHRKNAKRSARTGLTLKRKRRIKPNKLLFFRANWKAKGLHCKQTTYVF